MLPELGVERLVGLDCRGELLGVPDDQVLELAELGRMIRVSRQPLELRRGEADPLTEGDVQGDSVLAPVELGRPEIGELAQLAIQRHFLQRHAERHIPLEDSRRVGDHFVKVEDAAHDLPGGVVGVFCRDWVFF
jgi:hypothetical protein